MVAMFTLLVDDRALNMFSGDLAALSRDLAGTNRMRQPLLEIAKEVLAPSIDKSFKVGGRPKRWEASSPVSTYRLQKDGESEPTLWVTGKMKRAASALARFKVRENTMTYGYFPPTLWYAMVHDSASVSARADIPHRPFALIQSEDVPKMERILMDWVERQVSRNIRLRYP